MEIPDKEDFRIYYPKLIINYKQIKTKLNTLNDPTYQTNTAAKQICLDIISVLNDMRQTLKLMNGVNRDNDTP